MPSLDELASLYDKKKPGYRLECTSSDWKVYLTPLIKLTCGWVWAKETKDDGSRAANFGFDGGGRYWGPPGFDYYVRALPVRVGN